MSRESRTRRSTSSLQPKLLRPRTAHVQPRQRLFDRLDSLAGHPLTWIDGPAGAGKTTLAAAYVERAGVASVWYRIDASDADPAALFHHLAAAVVRLSPALVRRLPALTPDHLATIGVYAQSFFVEACRHVRRRLVFVFDGWEAVGDAPGVAATLVQAAEVLPERARIIVVSRAKPGPAFARAQLHRSLARMDAAELRMTEQEAIDVAAARRGGRLTEDEEAHARRAWAAADGWVAGVVLQFAARRTDTGAGLSVGEHRQPLFDYFAQEVFDRIDDEGRSTLLRIAALPYVTVPLAEALTGLPRCGEILAELHRQNYFISCAADAATYRLHPLFREFLMARQRQALEAAAHATLQRQCAALLETAGDVDEALECYRSLSDWEGVARLVRLHAATWVTRSQFQTLDHWLTQLPAAVAAADPWLLYWRGVCRTPRAPADARRDLEAAYDGFDRAGSADGLYAAWSAIIGTLFAEWSDFSAADRWVSTFDALCQRHPRPAAAIELQVASAVVCVLSHRYLNHPMLNEWLPRAEGLVRRPAATGNPAWLDLCLVVVLQHLWMGRIEKVGPLVRLLEAAADDARHSPAFRIAVFNVRAIVTWLLGPPAAADRLVRDALDLAARHGLVYWRHQLMGQGATAALLCGAHAQARRYIDDMRASAEEQPDRPLFWSHLFWIMAVNAIDSRPDVARAHAEAGLQRARDARFTFGAGCNLVVAANAAFSCGARDAASAHLADLKRMAEQSGSVLFDYWAQLTEAAWVAADDRDAGAPERLREALATSRRLGGPAAAGIARASLASLYAAALERGIEPEHVNEQIARFALGPPPHASGDAWPFPIKIRTLGRFSILRDGVPIAVGPKAQKRPLTLLKALVAGGGSDVSERELCDRLWPDADADLAHQSLKAAIHRARKLVGNDAIVYQAGRLALESRRVWVDAWAVEGRLNAVLDAAAESTAHALASSMEVVLRLYRGTFLGGDDEELGLGLRERLRSKIGLATIRLSQTLERDGRVAESVRYLERTLDAEPGSEQLYEELMRLHMAQGQSFEALRTYRRCRTELRRASLPGPSARTEALRTLAERAGAERLGSIVRRQDGDGR